MPKLIRCIALQVKTRREMKKLTQEKLGEMIGVSEQTIWSIEKEKKGIAFDTITKLADALECEETDLTSAPISPMTIKSLTDEEIIERIRNSLQLLREKEAVQFKIGHPPPVKKNG